MTTFTLIPGKLTTQDILQLSLTNHELDLDPACWQGVRASESYVNDICHSAPNGKEFLINQTG